MVQQIEWKELLKQAKFPDLMKDEKGEYQPMINMGLKYKEFIQPLYKEIKKHFDSREKDPRVALVKRQIPGLFKRLRSFFESETGAKCNEITVTRLNETNIVRPTKEEFERDKHWISALWHYDNFANGSFKMIIYCTEVTEDSAPTEFREPIEYYLRDNVASDIDTRFNDLESGNLFTCPAYTTLIFAPNIKHRGNYIKKGYRDSIMLGFNYRGPGN